MTPVKSIHFIGIKGVGMTPLAIIAKEAGITVTGSDVADEYITDASLKKANIVVMIGFSADHINEVDLVITTGAHGGFDNVEVKAAKEKRIPVITQGEAVGVFMQGEIFRREQIGISIFGSHGKTTTTAMIATILTKAGLDPSYVIGTSDVPSLGQSGHFGKGEYFIAEADEYATEPTYDKKPKLLWQHPKIAVCTNIELDHPDIYTSVDDLRKVFTKFVTDLPEDGMFICCGDDPQIQTMLRSYKGRKKTYGRGKENDYVIGNIAIAKDTMTFRVASREKEVGVFEIKAAGVHNALNGAAAIIVGLILGIEPETLEKSLTFFSGSKRRLEYVGSLSSGALLYDDYAHHPTEISASIIALRRMYPETQIVCIFQPHTYSRTKVLYREFTKAFSHTELVILTDIYASAREKADPNVSMSDLASKINLNGQNAIYLPKPIDVIKYIKEKNYGKNTLIVTMGAGDVYKIKESLL